MLQHKTASRCIRETNDMLFGVVGKNQRLFSLSYFPVNLHAYLDSVGITTLGSADLYLSGMKFFSV